MLRVGLRHSQSTESTLCHVSANDDIKLEVKYGLNLDNGVFTGKIH
jgi:hypothetical protein